MDLVTASGAKRIVHLAAQAGVRYSIDNPFAYSAPTWPATCRCWRPRATTA
jgi:nucleoside-diphosphate-sugar epimerase